MSKPSRESGHNPRAITLETSKCQAEEEARDGPHFFHASLVQLKRGGRGDDLRRGCHWEEDWEQTDVHGQVVAHQGPSYSEERHQEASAGHIPTHCSFTVHFHMDRKIHWQPCFEIIIHDLTVPRSVLQDVIKSFTQTEVSAKMSLKFFVQKWCNSKEVLSTHVPYKSYVIMTLIMI